MSGTAAHVGSADDLGLVASLKAGDEQAFAGLVDGWSGWMLRLAREHVASHGVAEEVVQETWLAVLRGLDGFRGEASLRTWVHRILVNQAKRRGTREQRTVPFASLTPEDDGPTVDPSRFRGPDDQYPGGWRTFPEEWPEQVTLTREIHDVVATALTRLPHRQRVVVALRDLDGLTSEEVCDVLGITAGNQRVLLHRGRAAVRAHLESYLTGAPATTTGADE
jgi:RNA polymerase sigma-70 factor (ECF subfamily)